MKRLALLFCIALALTWLSPVSHAQVDINNTQIGPYLQIATNVTWLGSGVSAVNNNYIFTPSSPDNGFCFYVQNLDTALHGYSFTVSVTGDQSVIHYAGNLAAWTQTFSGLNYVQASSTAGTFVKISAAAKIAIVFTVGSPTTGNVSLFLVQTTQGGCATTPTNAVMSLTRLEASAATVQRSFYVQDCVTNPGAGDPIIYLAGNSATISPNVYFQRASVSTTVAGEFDVTAVNGGTACTNSKLVSNTNLVASPGSTLKGLKATCSVVPSTTGVTPAIADIMSANSTVTNDISGFWEPQVLNTNSVLGIISKAAVTGTVCGSLSWSEVY